MPSLGKTSSRMALFRYFHPTTDHWREIPCVVFLHHHLFTSTVTQLIRKRHGNYTHNKSEKIKTFENLIIKMFQQNRKILILWNFVPIPYIRASHFMSVSRSLKGSLYSHERLTTENHDLWLHSVQNTSSSHAWAAHLTQWSILTDLVIYDAVVHWSLLDRTNWSSGVR